jgi:hypothetical protein
MHAYLILGMDKKTKQRNEGHQKEVIGNGIPLWFIHVLLFKGPCVDSDCVHFPKLSGMQFLTFFNSQIERGLCSLE